MNMEAILLRQMGVPVVDIRSLDQEEREKVHIMNSNKRKAKPLEESVMSEKMLGKQRKTFYTPPPTSPPAAQIVSSSQSLLTLIS